MNELQVREYEIYNNDRNRRRGDTLRLVWETIKLHRQLIAHQRGTQATLIE